MESIWEGSGLPIMTDNISILDKKVSNVEDTYVESGLDSAKETVQNKETLNDIEKSELSDCKVCVTCEDEDKQQAELPLSASDEKLQNNDVYQTECRSEGDSGNTALNQDRQSPDVGSKAIKPPAMNESSNSVPTGDRNKPVRQRFNPFNNEFIFEEDHFSEVESTSSSDSHAWSFIQDVAIPSRDNLEVSFAELGLAEDHFSHPEGHFGQTSEEELNMAIENCKELIRQCDPSDPLSASRQQKLVQKLIQLRMHYQELKEGPVETDTQIKVVMSHKFKVRVGANSHPCEKCKGVIWGLIGINTWYKCQECGYRCHQKCLNSVTRMCPSAKIAQGQSIITDICPERGLSLQKFRCVDCREPIEFQSNQGWSEPRLCDYSGLYYCELCHWGDEMVIPARVVSNWDFEPQKVSRASRQFLKLMLKKPVLDLEKHSPLIFNMSEELRQILKLRKDILIMKQYFIRCQFAREDKLLLLLQKRQHFVENSNMFSLQDLIDADSQILLPELTEIVNSFLKHIKKACQLCRAKGYTCEICHSSEVLFPFDIYTKSCETCSQVFHRKCFTKLESCPRCDRRAHRQTFT
ncbi:differentially expressed in FDCP 8 homolog B isoform X1 [Octopus sinensis]|uniref:Differentially expressed in FDCP 8 homolog B isoform X1 n=1 Tax=Octopus sinensis TaxID=2607531 RepID=A0A6P7SR36_9MOLL|nr:differentially expressed in FDCP 8 homolog B isoform X1 [Octopus sinensis]XP_036363112.1 differentially expressed in FDCP 8 homolog B isoform X1 [Octopus sinensis]